MKIRKCWHEAPQMKNGDMSPYPSWNDTMQPCEPFETTLRFCSISRGRSSAIALFFRSDGRQVPMFMTHLQEVIPLLKDGALKARWVVVKMGENYGVALEEPPVG